MVTENFEDLEDKADVVNFDYPKWYWVNTGWGCGAMIVSKYNIVIDACAIFRNRFVGMDFNKIKQIYNCRLLDGE
jgi:hypothetical protein